MNYWEEQMCTNRHINTGSLLATISSYLYIFMSYFQYTTKKLELKSY